MAAPVLNGRCAVYVHADLPRSDPGKIPCRTLPEPYGTGRDRRIH